MAKKVKEEQEVTQQLDEKSILEKINKKYIKDGTVAYFLTDDDVMVNVKEWISTGSTFLDFAISNRPNGGLPVGRIVELAGMESCVGKNTLINTKIYLKKEEFIPEYIENNFEYKLSIDGDFIFCELKIQYIYQLLNDNYNVYVQTKNDEYTKITNYIEKGLLESYKVILDNGYNIEVSHEHLFFTNESWILTKKLDKNIHKILCDDNEYHSIASIKNIGLQEIVDITVEYSEHCYFGNGMLNHNSGKSLICAYAIKHTQEKGGIGVYFDTESAADFNFMKAIGVDIEKMIYININSLEQIYQITEDLLIDLNAQGNTKIVTIVIDSVAAAIDASEKEEGYEKAGWNTKKAIVNSKAMRKITNLISKSRALLIGTQQLRIKLGVSYGDDKTTAGGLAWQYYSTVRVRLAAKSKLKATVNGIEQQIGVETEASVKKTRLGPGGRIAKFQIYFDRGINDYENWVEVLEQYGLVEGKTSMFYYDTELKDKNGEPVEYKFRRKTFGDLITKEHPHLKDQIYKLLCEKMVMKYKTEDIDESDLSYETNYEEGNDSEIVEETNDKELQTNNEFDAE